MLLNFRAKNYKSFTKEMCFSMAASIQRDLEYSLFKPCAGGENHRVQCSSVVYGPNASGKSNIISAMDTFKAIIMRGNIRNAEQTGPNAASFDLGLIPNINSSRKQPVEFEIEFIEDSLVFKYVLSISIGRFLDENYHRKINSEELYLNNKCVFKRTVKDVKIEDTIPKEYLLFNNVDMNIVQVFANNGLSEEELFLTNGFKVMISSKLVKIFTDWISQKLTVIYRADSLELMRGFSVKDKKGIYVQNTICEAAKIFGANSNVLGFVNDGKNDTDTEARLCSILKVDGGKTTTAISADVFESYGTVRFVNLFPLILKAFATGATLVIDEFDASIHPSALMNIINMFHNDDLNQKHAQLIFNTHNPIFLSSNLFRRDEIKFVQHNHDINSSEVYSLSDFGTSGESGVRNSTDYMKYYLNYRYGAIEDVDFTPVLEGVFNHKDDKDGGK